LVNKNVLYYAMQLICVSEKKFYISCIAIQESKKDLNNCNLFNKMIITILLLCFFCVILHLIHHVRFWHLINHLLIRITAALTNRKKGKDSSQIGIRIWQWFYSIQKRLKLGYCLVCFKICFHIIKITHWQIFFSFFLEGL